MYKLLISIIFVLTFITSAALAETVPAPTISSVTATSTPVTANQATPTVNQTTISPVDRIAVLENSVAVLQTQLGGLMQKITSLEQNEAQFKQAQDTFLGQITLANNIKSWLSILSAAVVALFLLALIQLFFFGNKKASAHRTETPTEEDFDLMGATEGVAAKLNLARAYLDMQNKEAAKVLLQEVATAGNPEQQKEAQTLLEKI